MWTWRVLTSCLKQLLRVKLPVTWMMKWSWFDSPLTTLMFPASFLLLSSVSSDFETNLPQPFIRTSKGKIHSNLPLDKSHPMMMCCYMLTLNDSCELGCHFTFLFSFLFCCFVSNKFNTHCHNSKILSEQVSNCSFSLMWNTVDWTVSDVLWNTDLQEVSLPSEDAPALQSWM